MTSHDARSEAGSDPDGLEDFKPTGTVFLMAMFVVTLILLWASVYAILLARGVTT